MISFSYSDYSSKDLRLVRNGETSTSLSSGRLEVYYRYSTGSAYSWMPFCYSGFDSLAADVACKQLGYDKASSYSRVGSRGWVYNKLSEFKNLVNVLLQAWPLFICKIVGRLSISRCVKVMVFFFLRNSQYPKIKLFFTLVHTILDWTWLLNRVFFSRMWVMFGLCYNMKKDEQIYFMSLKTTTMD